MTRRTLLALLGALLAVAVPGRSLAAGPTDPRSPPTTLLEALSRLLDEDVAGSQDFIEQAAAAAPTDRNALAALGLLRFYQHRYAEAVDRLEQLGPAGNPTGYLTLARAARDLDRRRVVAESEHFQVAYPKGKDQVLVPYLLETLEAQRAALLADLGLAPPGKVRVEILESPAELSRLSSLTDAEIRASGTIALCKYDKLMVVSPKALVTGYDWLDTAAHEYTHYVVTLRSAGLTPIWLHEGIAKWSETRWRGAGGEDFSPFSAALLRRALEQNQLVTFEQMHPSMAKLPTQELAALAFAEVVMAVELLVQRGGPGAVGRVLDRVGAGVPADQAVAATLGLSWTDFLAAWRRHMATRPLPRGGEQALRRLRFKDDPKASGPWVEWADLPVASARDHARLGELFRERSRWAAARVEYQKALDLVGARYPILASQFAVAAVHTGRKAEAEKALGEAIAWSPGSAGLRVKLARLLVERKEHAAARTHLLAANAQDPFDPEIHAGLALSLEALGDPGGASRERRFAEILAGKEPTTP